MGMIRAFVGHSFTEEDKILIDTFLEYFDQIKEIGIGFTWDHAKAAEPRELAKKVMDIIRDKNVFIGICTKRERVIGASELERCWIKRMMLQGHGRKLFWKTSDWIIQEIGLAIGRDMALILLIEEGLRLSGGLQGNIEYISFNRQHPEGSFGKILEMIRTLIPKVVNNAIPNLDTTSPESTVQEQGRTESNGWWCEPKPEWDYIDYEIALMNSIKTDNPEIEKKISTAFLDSRGGQSKSECASWEALTQYLRLSLGKGGTLNKMEQLAKDEPEVIKVQYYLGKAYDIYKEYEKAGKAYKQAAEKAESIKLRIYNLGEAVKVYCRGAMKVESQEITERMRQEVLKSGIGEETLITSLREIADNESDMDVYYGLSERLLVLKPGDIDSRFNLAYKYSQGKEQELSLFHYLRIPEPERSSAAWNNLGVQHDHFQIVCSSISSYRKAEQANETLAMSNIADKFIRAGFLPEAETICSDAIKIENYHNNISHTMARIREIPDEEAKKEEKIIKEAALYSEFYKEYGRGLCKTNPSSHSGIWEGPECNLCLEIQGHSFTAEGTYNLPKKQNGQLWSYLITGVKEPPVSPEKRILKYIGTIIGYSIKTVMTDEANDDEATSGNNTILTSSMDKIERTILMVISDSFTEIRVYDKDGPETKKMYVLKKLNDN